MIRRAGFTLMEVLVAIVVATGVVVTARAILVAIADGTQRLADASAVHDAERNADQLLRTTLLQARTLSQDSVSFLGTPKGFVLHSWCPAPGGWTEPCDVAVAVLDSTPAVVVRPGVLAADLIVRRALRSAELRYLASAANGGTWLRTWSSSSDLPLAVGLLIDCDTLMLPVGK
jgi:prepilin-type N-terminal cleavage/methylation domain-containing protein